MTNAFASSLSADEAFDLLSKASDRLDKKASRSIGVDDEACEAFAFLRDFASDFASTLFPSDEVELDSSSHFSYCRDFNREAFPNLVISCLCL